MNRFCSSFRVSIFAHILLTCVTIAGLGGQRAFCAPVVINEINYHPASDLEMEEFVEILNYSTTETVDLTGWSFVNGIGYSFTTGTTIGPGELIAIAKDPVTLAALAQPTAAIVGPSTGGLQNSGERIELADNLGAIVDTVRYNDAPPWPTTPDGRGASLERIDPTEPGDDPANWTAASASASQGWVQVTQTGTATSGRLYIYLDGPGEILIDDVTIVADGYTTNHVNNGDFEGVFSPPWTPTGNHSGSIAAPDPDAHGGANVCRLISTGVGGSSGDSLNQYTQALDTTGGTQYNLSFWVKPVSGGVSVTARLSGNGLLVNYAFPQQTTSMTPGWPNTAYQANLPPFAEIVENMPACPYPVDATTVTAVIRDSDGVSTANLLYQTLTTASQSPVFTVPMTRTSGTTQLGTWKAVLPPQASRTLVRYRIEAGDTLGASRLRPDPTDAVLTFSYFQYADDVVSSIPVAMMYYFGPAVPQDALRGNVAFIWRPEDEVRWEVYDHIIRTARNGGHNVFFNNHFEFNKMSSINLVWEWTYTNGRTRYPLSEYMSYKIHRAVHGLSEKVGQYHFILDDAPQGYFLMFEQPNKTFLDRRGLDNDGNLYKIRWNTGPEKKTNLSLGSADIVDLQNSVNSLTGPALTQYIYQNINVDQVIGYYVANQLTTDWDGYFNNHYLYHDIEVTGLWYIIPWDRDKTWGDNDAYNRHPTGACPLCYAYSVYDMPILFGSNDGPCSWGSCPATDGDTWGRPPGWLSGPFLADPVVQKQYIKRLEDVTLRIFTAERWFPELDALEDRLTSEVIYRAPLYGQSVADNLAEHANDIQSIRNHFIYRRQFLLSQLDPLTFPNVTDCMPASGSILTATPTDLVLRFTEPISTPTIHAASFLLTASGGDDSFGEPNDVPIAAASPPALVLWDEARFSLSGITLQPDLYRITLLGDGADAVLDESGNRLDGEYLGTLPSGDGAQGGNFVSEFRMTDLPSLEVPSWKAY